MRYTDADERADTAFLVGVSYGRGAERARMVERFTREADASTTGIWREAVQLLERIANER